MGGNKVFVGLASETGVRPVHGAIGAEQMAGTDRIMLRGWIAAGILLVATAVAQAEILPQQVLVVYNAASADGTALKNSYLAAHPGIPAANVLALNNPGLLVGDVLYSTFVSSIRNPIRNHLSAPGDPTPEGIVAIVLIRPFPHRIFDTDLPQVGDVPANAASEFDTGDATFASVDSELTLLWQNLDAGELGGTMDSKSDNVIDNPYHTLTAGIETFTRANITVAKIFDIRANQCWLQPPGGGSQTLTPGDMYLVSRIDGRTLAQAQAVLTRAQNLLINKAKVRVLLDEYNLSVAGDLDDDFLFVANDPFKAGDDYEECRDLLTPQGWDVRYDASSNFISSAEETNDLIFFASYGENHSLNGGGENPAGNGVYIDNYHFAPGAIFNTLESFNGRDFNSNGPAFLQEQAIDFLTAGGTFAVGNVWEPFTFSLPDNEFLALNFLVNGRTWGEAAWSAVPALSWQQLVVGDPIARAAVVNDPGMPPGDLNGDGRVDGDDIRWFLLLINGGYDAYRTAFPSLDPYARADFSLDRLFTTADSPTFIGLLLNP